MTSNADKLFLLAKEGQKLILENYEIPANPSAQLSQPVFDWLVRCNSLVSSLYSNQSEIIKEFSKAFTLKMSVDMLFKLANKEAEKESRAAYNKESSTDRNSCDLEIETKIERSINSSVVENRKIEAQQLFALVRKEVTSLNPDWHKIRDYLKNSFDLGMTYAFELTEFAYSCYKENKTR